MPDTPPYEPLAIYDLRLRSLDPIPGEPIDLCYVCDDPAHWSVWLHTPEWGPQGGATSVLCTADALDRLSDVADAATRYEPRSSPPSSDPLAVE